MSVETGKRVTLKRTRPNPLFQEWLEELYDEAKESKSKLEQMLAEALDSLSKYPLPLQSGAECILLKGFNKKLCIHLDKRLEVYRHNLALADTETKSSHSSSTSNDDITPMSVININVMDKNEESQHNSPTFKQNVISVSSNASESNFETHSQDTAVSNPSTSSEINPLLHSNEAISNPSSGSETNAQVNGNKKQIMTKKYKPAHRSGGYAILIALLEASDQPGTSLTKEIIIEKAQKHSEESFVRPKPDSFYTAWSNMSKLVKKGLISKVRYKKVEYCLTEEGLKLAKELLEDSKSTPTLNDIIFANNPPSRSNEEVTCSINGNENGNVMSQDIIDSLIELPADSFDIILLIDKNETGGLSKKNDPTVAQFNKYPDLKHEYRSLKVGDFTWIAKHRTNIELELVLPYVIERKRMDDLGASIKDGRFHEQKFRLRKCGLKNVIYLVENYGRNKHVGLPIQNLIQSLANTRVQDGFKVHITDSLTNSARFLAMMTKRLTIRYKDKNLKGCNNEASTDLLMSFEYFNKASAKTKALTVTETFIKLLLQLKGLSVEKALAITLKYKTPRSLIIAYQNCDRVEGEYLLANLKYGGVGRNVGPVVSKSIYQLFSNVGIS